MGHEEEPMAQASARARRNRATPPTETVAGPPPPAQARPVPVVRDRSFEHHGHRLVYDVYGSGPEVVVYLHGLLMDSDLNRGIAASLAERGDRVVLLDLLGHGRSDKPLHATEYRMDTYADQVVALLDHLGVDRAVVGGVSLGANVALMAAARHPDRVRGLVLEMPVMEWALAPAGLAFIGQLLVARYGRLPMAVLGRVVRALPRTPIDPLNSALAAVSAPPQVMAAVLHGILVGPVVPSRTERQGIDAPTLVLAHRNDLIHPFDDAANLIRELPQGRLLRAHSPLELRLFPRRLTAEVAAFVAELD
jgi:pimeloyl-ACP methyl ester carboxylesterase